MRVFPSLPPSLAAFALLALSAGASAAAGCVTPESALRDKIKDAQKGCDRAKDPQSCFYAGTLAAEGGGPNPEAVKYWVKGCALKHPESCESLATTKGSLRETALVEGCNAGDLVSCNRRANEFSQDEKGAGEARALRQQVCKTSTAINANTTGRDMRGMAEACAALARMVAGGQGGGKDEIAAMKLEVLATTLRTEALFRHEHEQDGKPPPAIKPPEPPVRRGGLKKPVEEGPEVAERDKNRREFELSRGALEAWLAGVQNSMAQVQKSERQALARDPALPTFNPVDRAMSGAAGATSAASSKCAACVDGCGSLERCAADDFAGGRCSHLKCAAGQACPQFDACVAECTAKADACAKGCGDCSADAAKGAK